MDYFVIGADGQEYGPANVMTLVEWVKEGRVNPDTQLKEFQSGITVRAGSVSELFPPTAAIPPVSIGQARPPMATNQYATPPSAYPRMPASGGRVSDPGSSDVWWAIGRSGVGIVLAVLVPGAGIIWSAYSIFYAVRAYKSGHRLGLTALIISVVALVIVLALFFLRQGSRSSFGDTGTGRP